MTEPAAIISMDVTKLEPKISNERNYLYAMLRFSRFANEIKEHANGANVLHLNPEHIENFETLHPPSHLVKKFDNFFKPMLEHADTLALKNEWLKGARDLLLPRLISGEIDVSSLQFPTDPTHRCALPSREDAPEQKEFNAKEQRRKEREEK